MNDNCLILAFEDYAEPAKRLAHFIGCPFALIDVHHFPDGESRLRLPVDLPQKVVLCRSLNDPNEKLVELILAAEHLRGQGVAQLILVAPYLCYMRQDKAFHPGEVVSQTIIGHLLANYFDGAITVDAHLHRVHRLHDALPMKTAINLTATRPMAQFLEQRNLRPVLIGPDGESEQWVSSIAQHEGLDYCIAQKERLGDKQVVVTMPACEVKGRDVVLVDDVASTGRTLEAAARQLQDASPASLSVMVTHALFLDDAVQQLQAVGVENIWSCDSIPHASNRIHLDELLGEALQEALTA
ncbi:MAG TPA: ribose-phosphate diphosphokinase [Thiolapillus brandeum]|uniref:Ribose-phosphate diphosphokinase n=1 Tax=Thiolapillus brandeum TaxID=1076588 RepID=A0A831RV72_9GAMM|nr:ribose-phosphate diphosphokinase [Thiolapillus brandeum]